MSSEMPLSVMAVMESEYNEDQKCFSRARQAVERETAQKGRSRRAQAGSKEDSRRGREEGTSVSE